MQSVLKWHLFCAGKHCLPHGNLLPSFGKLLGMIFSFTLHYLHMAYTWLESQWENLCTWIQIFCLHVGNLLLWDKITEGQMLRALYLLPRVLAHTSEDTSRMAGFWNNALSSVFAHTLRKLQIFVYCKCYLATTAI